MTGLDDGVGGVSGEGGGFLLGSYCQGVICDSADSFTI